MVTKKDAYPLPYISTILDRLRDARYISSIDIKSAFWQVPLSQRSKEYTAFTVPGRGLYQFCRMPFGPTNAPATWQRVMDTILGPELEPHVFVYLDDVIIISNNFTEHLGELLFSSVYVKPVWRFPLKSVTSVDLNCDIWAILSILMV